MKYPYQKAQTPAMLILLAGVAAASTAAIIIRLAQHEGTPSLVIAALRLSFASLLLTPPAIIQRRDELRRLRRREILLLVLAGLFLALHFGTWITSLEYTSVASSAVLVQTTPVWVAVLGFLLARELPRRGVMLGLGVTLIGGGLIAAGSDGRLFLGMNDVSSRVGNILALAGAFFMAAYLFIGRWMRAGLSLLSYIWVVYSAAAIFLVAAVLLSGKSLTGYPASVYLWGLALAVGPQILGHSSFNYALRYVSMVVIAVALLGEPVGSVILAYLIFHQPPTIIEIVGGCLILAGITLASLNQAAVMQPPSHT